MISPAKSALGAATALLATLAAGPAAAQDDCLKSNRLDQNCANVLFNKADHDLNAAYALAIASMRKADLKQVEALQGYEKSLRAAQRAWVAFRQAECDLAGFTERGGSGAGIAKAACAIDMTNERTKFLNWAASFYSPPVRQKSIP